MRSRVVLRLLAVVITTSGLLPVLAGASWACSCVSADLAEKVHASNQVYAGRITDVTQLPGTTDITYAYTVAVSQAIKGEPGATARVASPAGDAQCGIVLHTGRVVVFDRAGDGNVNQCDGTTQQDVVRVAAAARLAQSGPAPEASDKFTSVGGTGIAFGVVIPPGGFAAFAVLVAAGLVLLDVRRQGGGSAKH